RDASVTGVQTCALPIFYPKRLTRMYTHFTFALMAHCTSGAIRGSVSCLRTGNRTSTLLITKRLLYLLYHCRSGHMTTLTDVKYLVTAMMKVRELSVTSMCVCVCVCVCLFVCVCACVRVLTS